MQVVWIEEGHFGVLFFQQQLLKPICVDLN